jgi:hypothetical protein
MRFNDDASIFPALFDRAYPSQLFNDACKHLDLLNEALIKSEAAGLATGNQYRPR